MIQKLISNRFKTKTTKGCSRNTENEVYVSIIDTENGNETQGLMNVGCVYVQIGVTNKAQ